jgi:hypothetical protein
MHFEICINRKFKNFQIKFLYYIQIWINWKVYARFKNCVQMQLIKNLQNRLFLVWKSNERSKKACVCILYPPDCRLIFIYFNLITIWEETLNQTKIWSGGINNFGIGFGKSKLNNELVLIIFFFFFVCKQCCSWWRAVGSFGFESWKVFISS